MTELRQKIIRAMDKTLIHNYRNKIFCYHFGLLNISDNRRQITFYY